MIAARIRMFLVPDSSSDVSVCRGGARQTSLWRAAGQSESRVHVTATGMRAGWRAKRRPRSQSLLDLYRDV